MEDGPKDAGSGRVVSIDALRGFDMFWIIGGGLLLGVQLNRQAVGAWGSGVTSTFSSALSASNTLGSAAKIPTLRIVVIRFQHPIIFIKLLFFSHFPAGVAG